MLHNQSVEWLEKEQGNEIWKNWCPKRGEIFLVNLGENEGSILNGIRPAVVVSNNMNNKHSTVIHVSPLTSSQTKTDIPVHVKISTNCGLKEESIILTEQITTIDIRYGLLDYVGKIDEVTMKLVDKARNIQLGDMVEKSPLEKLPKYKQNEINETLQYIYSYEKVLGRSKTII
jgi:mRNA interferase MazF